MFIKLKKENLKKIPKESGVYLFYDKNGEPLYVGKTVNLRKRIAQYLERKTQGPFLNYLLKSGEKIKFERTDSEILALILESQLIKKLQPKFNIMLRDDKQYFYLGFTKEEFPKLFITHQPITYPQNQKSKNKLIISNYQLPATNYEQLTDFLGPFTDGNALKSTLRLLRKIFPYCTCKQKHNNFCLNYHIGKCLGYCCLKNIDQEGKKILKIYKKNINAIKDIFSGKKDGLIKKLKKELIFLAKKEEFEKAAKLKNSIEKLEKIFKNAKIIQESKYRIADFKYNERILSKMTEVLGLKEIPSRIEAYDVSNIQGKYATGAMVVFENGKENKNEYRKFKIKQEGIPNDLKMLKEILRRRFKHREWAYPKLVLIDGGEMHLNVAKEVIPDKIPIISLAKGGKKIYLVSGISLLLKNLPPEVRDFIVKIDSEAHRFAISYYRKLHRKAMI